MGGGWAQGCDDDGTKTVNETRPTEWVPAKVTVEEARLHACFPNHGALTASTSGVAILLQQNPNMRLLHLTITAESFRWGFGAAPTASQ